MYIHMIYYVCYHSLLFYNNTDTLVTNSLIIIHLVGFLVGIKCTSMCDICIYFFTDETKKCELLEHLREQLTNKRMIYSKNQLQLSTTVGQGLDCVLCSNSYVCR